ncbi:hypothetical protein MYX65_12700 [Acidobacteria bacterium AH-259-L09]|nr:hypothetical protein [Acidobacteria bacterium AH-259-L09]
MAGFEWVRTHYLDASALVKLVVNEGDCGPIRQFFNSDTNFCATLLCLAEALGTLKRKWTRKDITAAGHPFLCIPFDRTFRSHLDSSFIIGYYF